MPNSRQRLPGRALGLVLILAQAIPCVMAIESDTATKIGTFTILGVFIAVALATILIWMRRTSANRKNTTVRQQDGVILIDPGPDGDYEDDIVGGYGRGQPLFPGNSPQSSGHHRDGHNSRRTSWGLTTETPRRLPYGITVDDAERFFEENRGSRESYDLAMAFERANPYQMHPVTLSPEERAWVVAQGASAWRFDPHPQASIRMREPTMVEFTINPQATTGAIGRETCVQTNLPVPKTKLVYYFEVKIVKKDPSTNVSVGWSTRPFPWWRMTGTSRYSIGYHSHRGLIYRNHPFTPLASIEEYAEGDVIGCGFRHRSGKVFFTRNGELMGILNARMFYTVYPTLSSNGPCVLQANFGLSEFLLPHANVRQWGFANPEDTRPPPPAYGQNADTYVVQVGPPPEDDDDSESDLSTLQGLEPSERTSLARESQSSHTRLQQLSPKSHPPPSKQVLTGNITPRGSMDLGSVPPSRPVSMAAPTPSDLQPLADRTELTITTSPSEQTNLVTPARCSATVIPFKEEAEEIASVAEPVASDKLLVEPAEAIAPIDGSSCKEKTSAALPNEGIASTAAAADNKPERRKSSRRNSRQPGRAKPYQRMVIPINPYKVSPYRPEPLVNDAPSDSMELGPVSLTSTPTDRPAPSRSVAPADCDPEELTRRLNEKFRLRFGDDDPATMAESTHPLNAAAGASTAGSHGPLHNPTAGSHHQSTNPLGISDTFNLRRSSLGAGLINGPIHTSEFTAQRASLQAHRRRNRASFGLRPLNALSRRMQRLMQRSSMSAVPITSNSGDSSTMLMAHSASPSGSVPHLPSAALVSQGTSHESLVSRMTAPQSLPQSLPGTTDPSRRQSALGTQSTVVEVNDATGPTGPTAAASTLPTNASQPPSGQRQCHHPHEVALATDAMPDLNQTDVTGAATTPDTAYSVLTGARRGSVSTIEQGRDLFGEYPVDHTPQYLSPPDFPDDLPPAYSPPLATAAIPGSSSRASSQHGAQDPGVAQLSPSNALLLTAPSGAMNHNSNVLPSLSHSRSDGGVTSAGSSRVSVAEARRRSLRANVPSPLSNMTTYCDHHDE
ncbi:Protein ssh4 [Dimargaris xerosporica]|nr:Protein ssh4 [Dimargaris xerosporica]